MDPAEMNPRELRRFLADLTAGHTTYVAPGAMSAYFAAYRTAPNQPCPVCAEPGGFHDLHRHGEHTVPPELTWKPGAEPRWAR